MRRRNRTILKVIILGDSGVGKTALINQYVNKRFSTQYKATIGADFMSKELVIEGKPVTLQIWDTAGQERFQSLGAAFYRGADYCVLCFDVNNAQSFEKLKYWREEFVSTASPKNPHNFPFVVLGNKIDIQHNDRVSSAKAISWCKSVGDIPYFETSAKEGVNIDHAFRIIVGNAFRQQEYLDNLEDYTESITIDRDANPNVCLC